VSANRLTEHFGADVLLDAITPGQADDWLLWMKVTKKYAGATIGRTVKHAKRFFRSAVRLGFLRESPFVDLKSQKQTNDARKFFVPQEAVVQVLDILPDAEWRLIFALCRYGGLRCPSEHLALTWDDIDWAHDRFSVKSPKTGERLVPIFAELRPFLAAAFEAADDGAPHVITRRRGSAKRWGVLLERILSRAGIPRLEEDFPKPASEPADRADGAVFNRHGLPLAGQLGASGRCPLPDRPGIGLPAGGQCRRAA
jgi:integrase